MNQHTILLGAGASADAGIPTATQLLECVSESKKRLKSAPHIDRAIDAALGGLRFAKPWDVVDVEVLYQTLVSLSDRREHFLAPFVGAWNERVLDAERAPTSDAAEAMASALATDLRISIESAYRHGSISDSRLDHFRQATQEALSSATGYIRTFRLAALHVLQVVAEKCWIAEGESDRASYFRPLLQHASVRPIWIATLNYDNTIELAAKDSEISVDRGVLDGSATVRFDSKSRVTLAKLHGSLDWSPTRNGAIAVEAHRNRTRALPALLFGAGNKLRITGPYLDLLFAFREQLERSEELHVCGYSFRDVHINYLIHSWLIADPSRQVIIADKSLSERTAKENYVRTIREAVDEMIKPFQTVHDPIERTTFLSAVERLTLVNTSAKDWAIGLPDRLIKKTAD